jgi:outer membrane protein assembly factor BamD (BamD/ComL family)
MYARAQEAEQQGKPREAVAIYRQILATYPESPQNYKAIFLIGFVYSEKLDQPDSARQMFEQVIGEYPDCEFEDDAQAMLRFLDGHLPEFEETPSS